MCIIEALFLGIFLSLDTVIESKEYCIDETFNPRCSEGEVIVMTEALYGRMSVGKCVPDDFGVIGCQKDVMHIVDSVCSGKYACSFDVSKLIKSVPCQKGFSSYLEAQYQCKKVTSPKHGCDDQEGIPLVQSAGVLSSYVSRQLNCGQQNLKYSINLLPGQQVNISIFDFKNNQNRNTRSCDAVGYVSEKGHINNISICRTNKRSHHVYTSNGRSVEILIATAQINTDVAEFLLEYHVFGCPDIQVPSNAWYRREGEYATIGCERSDKIWKIRCRIDKWEGVVGNCTEQSHVNEQQSDADKETLSLNKDFWFWIIIIVCLGVGILCVLCLVIIIVKCKRGSGSNPSTDKCGLDESHYRGLIRAQDAPPGYYPTGSTFSQTMPRNPNVSYPQKFATVHSDGRAPNYFVLDQEYMNMKDQNQV